MKGVKQSVALLRKAWQQVFIFEIVYKLLANFLVIPALRFAFNALTATTKSSYLSESNLTNAFSPIFIIGCIVIVIFSTVYFLLEIGVLLSILKSTYFDEETALFFHIKRTFFRIKDVFKPKNLWMIPFSMILVPITNMFLASSFIPNIAIPDVVFNTLVNDVVSACITLFVMFILILLSMFLMFTYNPFFIEGKTANESAKISFRLVKRRKWKLFKSLFPMSIILTLVFWTNMTVSFIIKLLILNNTANSDLYYLFVALFLCLQWLFSMLISIFSIGVSYCKITNLFYKFKQEEGMEIPEKAEIKATDQKKKSYAKRIIIYCILIFIVLFTASNKVYLQSNDAVKNEQISKITVTSLCIDTFTTPKDTLQSFELCIDSGADCIKTPVWLTKDGNLVALSNGNLKALTGVDKSVKDLTLDEIKKLEIVDDFDTDEKYEIASLEELINLCKGKTKLNIEIKSENAVQKTVDEIKKCGFESDCVISSFSYPVLQEVRKLAPNIKIGYEMSIAEGDIYSLDADFFEIESGYVNSNMISKIHDSGKEISIRTIDDEESLLKIIDSGVDNIVTNEPERMKELLSRDNNWIRSVMDRAA
ncbi:glycerophosphoryl diester phosphodiesterase membrane domain-containing protein [Ruminococcus sp.]|uniref:glycerophosphoryl diester phosphodiesterase membrane domain-containing protein n=1 Tax=Ruminococcus sp. TaxID=41978 RepID=UPI003EFC573E